VAVAATKKHLNEMVKALNDAYARGQVDEFRQIVTLESDNMVEAWKEGYSNLINADKHKNTTFPPLEAIDFEAGVQSAWSKIKDSIESNKGTIREYNSQVIVFNESKTTKKMYDGIKVHLVDFVQQQLGNYKLTDAKAEVEAGRASSFAAGAGLSDVGILKKGTHRLHKDNTAIGSARLAMTMKWMSKTRFFKDFLSSAEAKTIQDKYGDLLATWETKGSKKRGLKVTPNEDIKISVGAGKTNKPGDEPEDFGNIIKQIRKQALKWAKNAEIQGRAGSISIEKNAVNIVEHVVVGELAKTKGARVKKKTKSSTRKASKTNITSTGKSKKTTKSAKAKIAAVKRKRSKSSSASPLALITLINKELPDTVRKNMQSPQLQNRTGRFAESVRVTDVMQTAKGFPSIGYTYQRSPYGVFEDGGGAAPWSNGQRDPRQLIDRSIREIAAQFAIGRFYTRRQ
jgi:hypothetical protein